MPVRRERSLASLAPFPGSSLLPRNNFKKGGRSLGTRLRRVERVRVYWYSIVSQYFPYAQFRARAPKRGRGTAHTECMCIIKLAEKYLTRQNSAMSRQNSVCLDTMTEQCVKVIFGSERERSHRQYSSQVSVFKLFTEHSNADKKRRTVADSVANVGESVAYSSSQKKVYTSFPCHGDNTATER